MEAPIRDTDFPFATASGEDQTQLSVVVVETVLLGLVFILGTNTLLVLLAQAIHLSFKTYLIIGPILCLLCLIGTTALRWRPLKKAAVKDYQVLAALLLLGLLCGLLIRVATGNINSSDQYFYVPNVVYFLDHVRQPLDFQIHFLVGDTGRPIISPNQGTSLAYEYFRALIAFYTRINYLDVYYFSAAVMGVLLPSAQFLLINRFVDNPRRALLGTMVCLALLLIAIDGPRTFAIAAIQSATSGKFFVLSTGTPLFAAFSLSFFRKPSVTGWLSLVLCTMALTGMTISATVLLAILAAVLLAAFILTGWINSGAIGDWKPIVGLSGLYLSSLAWIFSYVLLLYVLVRSGFTTGDSFEVLGPQDFIGQLEFFFNLAFPLTLILIVLSPLPILAVLRGWQRQFLLLWMALLVLLFLNPVGSELFSDHFVPSNIYWRIFYLLPFPLSIGVVAASLSIPKQIARIAAFGVLVFGLTIYLLNAPSDYSLAISPYTLAITNMATAREIAAAAPQGAMLAPPELYGLIPMVDGFHPQIRTREDGDHLWLTPTQRVLREKASRFVAGSTRYLRAFSQTLSDDIVQTIVLKASILNGPLGNQTRTLLQKYAFVHQKKVGDYLILWK